uniref:Testis expressed 26 n=1 Tax=Myripristis murdjan TaxID=586833 RepID=A0A667XUV4_9TELE
MSMSVCIYRYPSKSYRDSYSRSRCVGSTVYNDDFCWKPACKPECIRTEAASGQSRNNPHPNQYFMMWRLPRGTRQMSADVGFPWNCPPSEDEIHKALTAQYCSTYRTDFTGIPQGCDGINNAERRLAPLHSRRQVPFCTDTEMRDNYRQTKQRPELRVSSCNAHKLSGQGIVPTVVQNHIHTQEKVADLTTYDRFFGKRVADITPVIKSVQPQELRQLYKILPQNEKEAVDTLLSKGAHPKQGEKVNNLPAVSLTSYSPAWISSWPGPH